MQRPAFLRRPSAVPGAISAEVLSNMAAADELGLERGGAHRLHQIAGKACLLERRQPVALARRDQDDAPRDGIADRSRRDLRRRVRADRKIDQHRVPVLLATACPARGSQPQRSTLAPQRVSRRSIMQASTVGGATISRATWPSSAGGTNRARPRLRSRGSGTMARKVEPLAGHAFDLDAAAHALDDAAGDRKPQAGAAELPGRAAVGLLEFVEDARLLLRRRCRCRCRAPRTRSRSLPAPASTTTLTPPVSVNLMALPARLSSTWRSRVTSPSTRSGSRSSTSEAISRPFACARGAHQLDHILDQRGERQRLGGKLELAGFDLGEIQDLLDQRQQRVAGCLGGLDVGGLLRRELRVAQQARAMPRMPFSGVRISCDTIARKRDLARLAASAASRASRQRAARPRMRSVTSRPTLCTSARSACSAQTTTSRQASQRGPSAVMICWSCRRVPSGSTLSRPCWSDGSAAVDAEQRLARQRRPARNRRRWRR